MNKKLRMDLICEFKIGDIVCLKVQDEIPEVGIAEFFRICERNIHECYGGVQVHYGCSRFGILFDNNDKLSVGIPGTTNLVNYSEPELVKLDLHEYCKELQTKQLIKSTKHKVETYQEVHKEINKDE